MNYLDGHPINSAKRKMLSGQPAIGTANVSGSPFVAEMLTFAGFDFVLLDLQHSPWTDESAAHGFRYITHGGATPMARVASNDYGAIGRLLDRGAMGIVVPMVNTREEAEAAAYAVRYPPHGGRSFGGGPPHYGPGYEHWINDEVFLAVQLETVQSVENAEAIFSVPGVDGCWIGPADLAKSMGIDRNSEKDAQAHRDMILRAVAACKKMGKIAGISGGMDIRFWLENDMRFVTLSGDVVFMLESAQRALKAHGR